jgi:hypothetical protein
MSGDTATSLRQLAQQILANAANLDATSVTVVSEANEDGWTCQVWFEVAAQWRCELRPPAKLHPLLVQTFVDLAAEDGVSPWGTVSVVLRGREHRFRLAVTEPEGALPMLALERVPGR